MVTIKDIARESGYSVSTVSRVVNHRNDVSPDAREKIQKVVAKYNFVPNNNAKHLKQNYSKSIGVLVKGISNMLFASILEEIQRIVAKTELNVVISYLEEDDDEVERAIMLTRERKPLGLLFLGGNPEFFREKFAEVEVPCVLVTNRANRMQFGNLSSVATDDVEAGRCAVNALIDAGHEKIGILGGDMKKSHTSYQRFAGCMMSFLDHGRQFDEEKCYEKVHFSYDSGYRGMKRLIAKYPDLTAVFAMSDVMAIGAIRALRDMNYRIPEDISIIGFDGIEPAEYYNPKLTTIKQQYRTLAARSVEILFSQIELKRDPVHEIVPFELVNGESIRKI